MSYPSSTRLSSPFGRYFISVVTAPTQRLLELGLQRYERGELEEALALFEGATLVASHTGDLLGEAAAWSHFGRASSLSCDPKVAEHALGHAARCYRRAGDEEGAQAAILRQAFMAYDAGDLSRAEQILADVQATTQRLRGIYLGYGANIARSRGDLPEAQAGYAQAVAVLDGAHEFLYAATFLMDQAVISLLGGRAKEAWALLQQAESRARDIQPEPMLDALVSHYMCLTLAALGATKDFEEVKASFRAPPCMAMDYLTQSHRIFSILFTSSSDRETRLAELASACPPYEHARLTLRILRGLLGQGTESTVRLVVHTAKRRIRLSHGLEFTFGANSAEWRILLALIAHQQGGEGSALSIWELIEAGWPGERLTPQSAKNRFHVALSNMRKRGLRAVLLRHHGGYALSNALEIICREE